MQLKTKLGVASWLDRLGLLSALKHYRASKSGLILTFHRVLPKSDLDKCYEPYIAMSDTVFEDLLKLLCDEFEAVSLQELLEEPGGQLGRQRIALTFDDGWEDTFSVAFPLLLRYEVPATVFICTGLMQGERQMLPEERFARIWNCCDTNSKLLQLQDDLRAWGVTSSGTGRWAWAGRLKRLPLDAKLLMLSYLEDIYAIPRDGTRRFLTWDEARIMQRGGIAFGSHTVGHSTLKIEGYATILHELTESRQAIFEHLGQAAHYLAYPNGAFDERVIGLVEEAGFTHGFTTRPGFVRRDTYPFAIPRISMADMIVTDNSLLLHRARTRLYLQQLSCSGWAARIGTASG